MPNLNNMMSDVIKQSEDIEKQIRLLLLKYEDLYREANSVFMEERSKSGTMSGLEDFYHLIHIVRRNRDVVGSLLRGTRNIRPMERFSFVEEDIQEIKPVKKRKSIPEKVKEKSVVSPVTEGVTNA